MRAKLDENLPVEAVALFREHGWHCDTVADEGLAGADDSRIAEVCRNETRVLLTLDLAFADITSRTSGRTHPTSTSVLSCCVLRCQVGRPYSRRWYALCLGSKQWTGRRLWIVEPARIRVRGSDDAAV